MTEDPSRAPGAPTDADLIREHLEALGLSQREAGRRLGIDDRTMRYYCAGKAPVPPVVFFALRQLARIQLNDRALALLLDGTMTASDGEHTTERLRRANRTLWAAMQILLRGVRGEETSMHLVQFVPVRSQRAPGRISCMGGLPGNVGHSVAAWMSFEELGACVGRRIEDHDDAYRVAQENIDALERVTVSKRISGDYSPHPDAGPRVDLVLLSAEDMAAAGEHFRDPLPITVSPSRAS